MQHVSSRLQSQSASYYHQQLGGSVVPVGMAVVVVVHEKEEVEHG